MAGESVLPQAVRKAVVPAAGLGTRFLPATKAVPKELLPVVDVPAIEYVVAEAARAGCHDVILVTGRGKDAITDHFDSAPEIEAALERKGDRTRLAAVRRSSGLAQIHAVRQGVPLGLGHAVLQARAHVGGEPFAVLLGDDLVDERDHLLEDMLAVRDRHGGSVVALMEVPPEQTALYGVAAVGDDDAASPASMPVTSLVEKPAAADAPSNLAVIGRYVLDAEVFDVLERLEPGRGGEIQLTDALDQLGRSGRLRGVVFRGRRYDTGDRQGYLRAVVQLACERPDIGPDFRAWLTAFVADLQP